LNVVKIQNCKGFFWNGEIQGRKSLSNAQKSNQITTAKSRRECFCKTAEAGTHPFGRGNGNLYSKLEKRRTPKKKKVIGGEVKYVGKHLGELGTHSYEE